MTSIESYGWTMFQNNSYISQKGESVGRVVRVKGFKYDLTTENGELETELSGRLLYGSEAEDLPKVGDWVIFLDYSGTGYIIDVLPRMNALSRKTPGNKTERQVLATNIDYALVVQGLDRDFNLMRLERYLTQITCCNIEPIVVLNKSDLTQSRELHLKEVQKLKRDCPVYFCSTFTGDGMQLLKDGLQPFKTYIMIGSSGVGKSSLLNVLMQTDVQRTHAVSSFNSKGIHTTTTRDLFKLPNGSLLIDTPGMREFGLTSENGDHRAILFPAVEVFAQACRYADCKHLNDSGCAVIAALRSGELSEQLYESYVKLMKEQNRFEIRAEDKKRLNRQFGKMTKEAKNHRRRNKY
jgi:ribosome biogenesis GTPase / thiamine phosphate phosphatase